MLALCKIDKPRLFISNQTFRGLLLDTDCGERVLAVPRRELVSCLSVHWAGLHGRPALASQAPSQALKLFPPLSLCCSLF